MFTFFVGEPNSHKSSKSCRKESALARQLVSEFILSSGHRLSTIDHKEIFSIKVDVVLGARHWLRRRRKILRIYRQGPGATWHGYLRQPIYPYSKSNLQLVIEDILRGNIEYLSDEFKKS